MDDAVDLAGGERLCRRIAGLGALAGGREVVPVAIASAPNEERAATALGVVVVTLDRRVARAAVRCQRAEAWASGVDGGVEPAVQIGLEARVMSDAVILRVAGHRDFIRVNRRAFVARLIGIANQRRVRVFRGHSDQAAGGSVAATRAAIGRSHAAIVVRFARARLVVKQIDELAALVDACRDQRGVDEQRRTRWASCVRTASPALICRERVARDSHRVAARRRAASAAAALRHDHAVRRYFTCGNVALPVAVVAVIPRPIMVAELARSGEQEAEHRSATQRGTDPRSVHGDRKEQASGQSHVFREPTANAWASRNRCVAGPLLGCDLRESGG